MNREIGRKREKSKHLRNMNRLLLIIFGSIVLGNIVVVVRGRGAYRPHHQDHQDHHSHQTNGEKTTDDYRPHHKTHAKAADTNDAKHSTNPGQIDVTDKTKSSNSKPEEAIVTLASAEAEAIVEAEAAEELKVLVEELERLVSLDHIRVGLNSLVNLDIIGKRSIPEIEGKRTEGIKTLIRKQRASCSDCEYCKYCRFCDKCPCDDVEGCKYCDQCVNCKYCHDSVCCFPCLWTSLC